MSFINFTSIVSTIHQIWFGLDTSRRLASPSYWTCIAILHQSVEAAVRRTGLRMPRCGKIYCPKDDLCNSNAVSLPITVQLRKLWLKSLSSQPCQTKRVPVEVLSHVQFQHEIDELLCTRLSFPLTTSHLVETRAIDFRREPDQECTKF